jgi:hypothetical protein
MAQWKRRIAIHEPQPRELWVLAVAAEGRRCSNHRLATTQNIDAALAAGAMVGLDHAGVRAAQWSNSRPVATHICVDPGTGRSSRGLDDLEWQTLMGGYRDALAACRAVDVPVAIITDGAGLWHTALSPLGGAPHGWPDRARTALLELLRVTSNASVAMVAEDLAPQGLDLTDCISLARQWLDAGAKSLLVGAGSPWLSPLWLRSKGASTDDDRHHSLASIATLRDALAPASHAVVPMLHDRGNAAARAAALGFQSVCLEPEAS